MLEVFLHSLKETAIIAAYIFVACIVIAFIEHSTRSSLKLKKLLSSPTAPLFGAAFGLVPQCGFSAISAKLYSQKSIKLGTLIAVFIATSDEAIPVLIAHPSRIKAILPLLVLKFLFALVVGFLLNIILSNYQKRKESIALSQVLNQSKDSELESTSSLCADERKLYDDKSIASDDMLLHDDTAALSDEYECEQCSSDNEIQCCCSKHKHSDKRIYAFFVHPLIHTLKIVFFVFLVVFLFGSVIFYIGEDKLMQFLLVESVFQPFLASLVGLIPNCAASVVITEIYVKGGMKFGSMLGALCVNAGVGFAVLFQQNKNFKQNISILVGLYILSSLFGMAVTAVECAVGGFYFF